VLKINSVTINNNFKFENLIWFVISIASAEAIFTVSNIFSYKSLKLPDNFLNILFKLSLFNHAGTTAASMLNNLLVKFDIKFVRFCFLSRARSNLR
jgi:hypothetical protein